MIHVGDTGSNHRCRFDGLDPHLRDFTGAEPTGAGRDAGAIEAR